MLFLFLFLFLFATPASSTVIFTLSEAAVGDTVVYVAEQRGPLELPTLLSETPIVMQWSATVQPAIIAEVRPILEMVAVIDSLGNALIDSLTNEPLMVESESGRYYMDRYFCSVVQLLLVEGVATARIQPEDNIIRDFPLDRVRVYSTRRNGQ